MSTSTSIYGDTQAGKLGLGASDIRRLAIGLAFLIAWVFAAAWAASKGWRAAR